MFADPHNILNDNNGANPLLLSTPMRHADVFNYIQNNQSQDSIFNLDYYNGLHGSHNSDDAMSQVSLSEFFEENRANSNLEQVNIFNSHGSGQNEFLSRTPFNFVDELRSKSPVARQLKFDDTLYHHEYLENDIMMVEQDSYDVYGISTKSFYDTVAAGEKDLNDLNIVKPTENHIMYEFSDDEDEDDDWESNRLDDSMDLDDTESHVSLREEDYITNNASNDDFEDAEEDIYSPRQTNINSPASEPDFFNNNSNTSNDYFKSHYHIDSFPQAINPSVLEKEPTFLSSDQNSITKEHKYDFKPRQMDEIQYEMLPAVRPIPRPTPKAPLILPSQSFILSSDDNRMALPSSEPMINSDIEEMEENKINHALDSIQKREQEEEGRAQNEHDLLRLDSTSCYAKLLHERSNSTDSLTTQQPSLKQQKIKQSFSKTNDTKNSSIPKVKSVKVKKIKKEPTTDQLAKESGQTQTHSGEEDHYCLIPNPKTGKPCQKKFSRPYDLIRHQNTIHAAKRSFYRCLFCEDDLRRKNSLEPINPIVINSKYRESEFSKENFQTQITSSTIIKKLRCGPDAGQLYMSNKTFSRCDALTRHLRFRHGLENSFVNEALEFAKNNVEFYEN